MKNLRLSGRGARRWLAAAGALAITGGLSGVALAADATGSGMMIASSSTVIKGCFNGSSGALRVVTPHSPSCGTERKISWNQTGPRGPAGNGYAFKSTTGMVNKYGGSEADGPIVTKAATYFVNVSANLDISAYTSGGSGFCALDIVSSDGSTFVFDVFSAWDYPAPASNINNSYPFTSSGMIHVSAARIGYQFILACFDNSFATVPVMSGTWLVSPVSAKSSSTVPVAAEHTSTLGPAGFRPKPALKP
ncbi:MAG TPA: hypothetical protein VEV63_07715 [Streptosporangiaceae bacterium]|nr:hypothetical protein [Streptosporangiaceae bacterium]